MNTVSPDIIYRYFVMTSDPVASKNRRNSIWADTKKTDDTSYIKVFNMGKTKIETCYTQNNDKLWSIVYDSSDYTIKSTTFKNGKVHVTRCYYEQTEQVKDETQYNQTGHIVAKKKYYPNGKLQALEEYHLNGRLKSVIEYDEQGNEIVKKEFNTNGKLINTTETLIDGNFDSSRQVGQGDCYLLASINAIRETPKGQELLRSLIDVSNDKNGNKVYTVTLPGAKMAIDGLKSDNRIKNNTIAITGTYKFTQVEFLQILEKAGSRYSEGDPDIILLEAAFEKYREEVAQTLRANNIDPSNYSGWNEAGIDTGKHSDNILRGGFTQDAIFVLTGQKSDIYLRASDVEFSLSVKDLKQGNVVLVPEKGCKGKLAASEVNSVTKHKSDLNMMLDKAMESPDSYFMTATFKLSSSGGHAFTVKKVTKNSVILINPWYPDQELTMSREDFLKAANKFTITKMPPKTDVTSAYKTTDEKTNPIQNSEYKINEYKKYKVPRGTSYTKLIQDSLLEQGYIATPQNIQKAKIQFESANPKAVHFASNKVPYLYAGDIVVIPKFDIN